MTTVGNIDYKKIENRQFVTVDTDKAADIISELTQKQVPFSGRYDDSRLTLHFSQKDWDIVQNALSGAARPHENDTSKAQQELDDLQQQLKRALERQKELEEQAAKVQQSQDKAEYTEPSVFSGQPQPEQLLPILQAKAIQHTEKLDALSEKRTALENKIQTNQGKIDRFSDKVQRLIDTNQMLHSLFQNAKVPGIKTMAEAAIHRNEQKIIKIQEKRIPKLQTKIQEQSKKIEKIDRKSDITQCKLDRCRCINQIIKSFGISDNADRRQAFSQAMDGLHQTTIQRLSYKLDSCQQKISLLSQKYMATDSAADKLKIHQKINTLKDRKQKITAKLDKLHSVTLPYAKQSSTTIDHVISGTEQQLKEAAETGKINMPVFAEKICVDNADLLPEIALSVPIEKPDQSLIPEIADLLNMSVSEVESKPLDIQAMLKDTYTANYFSDPSTLQETLTYIINPNYETNRDLQEHQEKDKMSPAVAAKEADSDYRKHEHSQEMPLGKTAATASSVAQSHLRSVEELTETNANMIDGILNNEKPEPEPEKPQKAEFSYSRNSMKALAAKVHDIPSNPPEKQRDELKK